MFTKIKELKIINNIGKLGEKDFINFDEKSGMPSKFKIPKIKIRGRI